MPKLNGEVFDRLSVNGTRRAGSAVADVISMIVVRDSKNAIDRCVTGAPHSC
ncbi:hypothetical protein [Bradyrhizobium sp. LHD-71]|uniref:hypothetical protein n=1 Tax=Bradyrhizobium sp. LHD-71 TaxID=3072141 RepID=UPI00280E9AEE|nr:hypothetical protein [Bradyrhizobium sp. LHD-71]MDQ8730185.1 hypothetical protein [Bradyrhizobium sp. LHD-71]